MPRLAILGGSMNPPTDAHVEQACVLADRFDRVVVVPCGIRPDKGSTNVIDPAHRANMVRMAFRGIPRVEVDLSDLERDEFRRTVDLDREWKERLGDNWDVWHAVGFDLIEHGATGNSQIQRTWHRGEFAWSNLAFVLLPRGGCSVNESDFPPRHLLMPDRSRPESSSQARLALGRGKPEESGVPRRVASYAMRYGLYGPAPGDKRFGRLALPQRPRITVVDMDRDRRARIERDLSWSHPDWGDADALLAVGGDGFMLETVRNIARPGLPIIGLNAGHRGFLLNDVELPALIEHIGRGLPFDVHLLPLLEVVADVRLPGGSEKRIETFAFNDAWVERSSRQTAWVRVSVDGEYRHEIPRLACDAALVSTPAGSTAYARAMGAPPQLIGTPVLTLAASAVSDPYNWHHAILPDGAIVTFEALDTGKRPIIAVVDGKEMGTCDRMTVRRSRTASVELAFLPGRSLGAKIAALQFPS